MKLQHHIQLGEDHLDGNGGVGRYVLLPGDPSRAARLAEHFSDRHVVENPRGHTAHFGKIESTDGDEPIDVLAIPTGVGSASAEVVIHELIACGARRLLRVGSCGTMADHIRPGHVVVATGAVRDEGTSDHYAPGEFPAVAHPEVVYALGEGARRADLATETFFGICHSKASLYAREFGGGPAGARNREYVEWLRRCGVVATEMEASTLFVMSSTAPRYPNYPECEAGAILAVFAADDSGMEFDPGVAALAETRAIAIALEAIRVWAGREHFGRHEGAFRSVWETDEDEE